MGLGASSYVILVQHRRSKEPDNIVFCGDGTGWPKAERLLKALRLLAPGDVSMGGMWLARAARFDVGCRPGLRMTGWSLPAPPGGSEYELTTGVLGQLPTVYGQLLHLDTHGLGQAPGNLDLGAVQGREGSRQRSCLLWEPSVLHSVAHHHGDQRGHNRQHLNRDRSGVPRSCSTPPGPTEGGDRTPASRLSRLRTERHLAPARPIGSGTGQPLRRIARSARSGGITRRVPRQANPRPLCAMPLRERGLDT